MVPTYDHGTIYFIGHLDWRFNPDRICDGSPAYRSSQVGIINLRGVDLEYDQAETEKNFIFSGIFYFLLLVPQTLHKMFGEEVEYDFYRCTGWPLIHAGLGGRMQPEHMLKEASLYPCKAESENYYRMLLEISPFINEELRSFFSDEFHVNLNEKAYDRMHARMEGKIEDFLLKIQEESSRFSSTFCS